MNPTREKMTRATIALLRRSGLAGAGINQVIASSKAPKGSLYYHFPGGKRDMVEAALQKFGADVCQNFLVLFGEAGDTESKLRRLFGVSASRLKADRYARGCAVAAVVLDLDEESTELAAACKRILRLWQRAIAMNLAELPAGQREEFAQFVLIVLEGALLLSRAERDVAPLRNAANMLAKLLPSSQAKRRRPGSAARRVRPIPL
jgi:TetR/AcrR family transcriptional regulator, lmrAB and yxaGH operons repressor